jgi:hypothetical protein
MHVNCWDDFILRGLRGLVTLITTFRFPEDLHSGEC